jgi:ADP-ribosyl-[dinitrogen reductase] hydrolase
MNGGTNKQQLHNIIIGADISDRRLRHSFESYQDFSQWKRASPQAFQRPKFVCAVLLAVLWTFFSTDTFAEGAVSVVNLGGDTDTTGAIYGGLAGVYYGYDAIPKHWLADLKRSDLVTTMADGIAALAASRVYGGI